MRGAKSRASSSFFCLRELAADFEISLSLSFSLQLTLFTAPGLPPGRRDEKGYSPQVQHRVKGKESGFRREKDGWIEILSAFRKKRRAGRRPNLFSSLFSSHPLALCSLLKRRAHRPPPPSPPLSPPFRTNGKKTFTLRSSATARRCSPSPGASPSTSSTSGRATTPSTPAP